MSDTSAPARKVPWTSLTVQHTALKAQILDTIGQILDSGMYVAGPHIHKFEELFAAHEGGTHALAVSNGTVALEVAMHAYGIGAGDEVITQPNSFFATSEAILLRGAKPVYVDIDPATYMIDVTKIEAAITPKTKAIVPVHLYGQPANMPEIRRIADKHKLVVIADSCQAHGGTINGQPHTKWADATCYSFYPTKNLGTVGEGGGIVSSDDAAVARMKTYRDHGMATKNVHASLGGNSRLSEIQGAILEIKMPHLDGWIAKRREFAAMYDTLLAGAKDITLPVAPEGFTHVYHLYIIRHPKRDALAAAIGARGVSWSIHYPGANHLQGAVAHFGYKAGDFPETERAVNEILTIPLFPEMTKDDVEYCAAVIREEAAKL